MTGCACPHPATAHAPRKHYGEAICLTPGCDCNGTHEDVTAANARRQEAIRERVRRLTPTNELLLSKIMRFISDEWLGRRLMTEIIAEFEVKPR